MKADFFQPRFTGSRFEEATIPLEIAKDLVSYETLVIELDKGHLKVFLRSFIFTFHG